MRLAQIAALLALSLILLGTTTGTRDLDQQQAPPSIWDNFPKSPYHPLPHSAYLAKQTVTRKPGVCITIDDGLEEAVDFATALIDSIRDNTLGTGNGNEIKITIGVMTENVGVGNYPTWAEMREQDAVASGLVEWALHGNATERFGPDGNQGNEFDSTARRQRTEDILQAAQQRLLDSLGTAARSTLLTNHHAWHGDRNLLIDNGIYQGAGLGVRLNTLATSLTQGQPTAQYRNGSVYPIWFNKREYGIGNDTPGMQLDSGGQVYGQIMDRWYIGRGSPVDSSWAPDSIMAACGMALQTGNTIYFPAFHNIQADGDSLVSNLNVPYATFRSIVLHIDSLMTASGGYFESYTVEEATAQLTGRVVGDLLPRGFDKLGQGGLYPAMYADTTTGLGKYYRVYPIGWPLDLTFYSEGPDSMHRLSDAEDGWKVVDAGDSILAAFTGAYAGDAATTGTVANDSLRFGSADSSRNVLKYVTGTGDSTTTKGLWVVVPTSGTDCDYITILIEVMADAASLRGNSFFGHQFGQFREARYNTVARNDTSATGFDCYNFGLVGHPNDALSPLYYLNVSRLQANRVFPLFNFIATADSAYRDTYYTGNVENDAVDKVSILSLMSDDGLIPSTLNLNSPLQSAFEATQGDMDAIHLTGADQILEDEISNLDTLLFPTHYAVHLRVNDEVDFVAGWFQAMAENGAQQEDDGVEYFVTSISAFTSE